MKSKVTSLNFKVVALVLATVLVLYIGFVIPYANAEDASQKLEEVNEQQNQAQEEKQGLLEEIEACEGEIETLDQEISEAESDIVQKQAEIDKLVSEIAEMQNNIDDQKNALGLRLRAMYKSGGLSFIDIVLESKDFSELMANVYMLQLIYESDQNVLIELEDEHQALTAKKDEVEAAKLDLQATKDFLAGKQAELEGVKDELEISVEEVQARINAFDAEAQSLNEQIRLEQERLAAEAAAAEAANNGYGSGSGTGTGSIGWPCHGVLTSYFGYRDMGFLNFHTGLDIAVPTGTPILAADSGVVMSLTGWYPQGYGWGVFVDHGGGVVTGYGHNSQILVSPGQYVEKGQVIALAGSTGWSTGPHCHFEVRINGQCTDPLLYL